MAQEALTGYRKYKSPYVSEINARKAYLPALYNQRRDDKYREQSYNLDKQGLAQNKEFALKNLELSEKAAHQARKRDKLAANLGYAGLGLQATDLSHHTTGFVSGGHRSSSHASLPDQRSGHTAAFS